MSEKNLLIDPPEKVQFMYQAVVSMIKDGSDINTMKVSDITAKAGIGKGTAYEYFSSKEELITCALAYDVEEKITAIETIVDGNSSFSEKIMQILQYVEDNFSDNQTFCTLVRIGTGSYEISDVLHQEYQKVQEHLCCNRMEQIMERLMRQGQTEKVIRQTNARMCQIALAAQIVGFAAYLMRGTQVEETELSIAEAKQFAYESLVRSLG